MAVTDLLLVDQTEVAKLLPMGECMDVMARALGSLARGQAQLPLRSILWLPERIGAFALMPGALYEDKVVGAKVVTFFYGNQGTDLDAHQGAVLLFEAERGRLLAVIDATSVTAIRTAAVSGVATRLLAREDASVLALVGAGVQARTHLEAMRIARPIRKVRVASKDFASARQFAERESQRQGIEIEPAASARDAIRGADVVCTLTTSLEPVVLGEWLEPGMHLNVVGSSTPAGREIDTAGVARSRLYVDRRESTLNESGEFLAAKKEGAIGDDHIAGEIGEVLTGKAAGRRSPNEITMFKSLGLAIEDVASAKHIYEKAKASGRGRFIPFGGSRDAGD
jgi:ornithine cyclodeaminase/alanine dehydrogenase-like protein (mu-crystallin family)